MFSGCRPLFTLSGLCIFLSLVSESHLRVTTLIDVPTIRNETQCRQMEKIAYKVQLPNRYNLRLNFDETRLCPPYSNKRGFECGVIMSLKDQFDAVGNKLCINLTGVADTISHNQFALLISDSAGEIARVYSKSSRFDRPPFNIQCSRRGSMYIHILLRAIETVKMCPNILPTLADHNTSLGTVLVQNDIPTHLLVTNDCSQNHRELFEEHSILKVIPGGSYRYGCAISLRPQVQYRQIQTCLTVEYLSNDFSCDVQVEVTKGMVEYLSFDIPQRRDWNPSTKTRRCFKFNWLDEPDNSFPNLVIRSSIWSCDGNFALELKYSRFVDANSSDYGPNSSINRRNLYMAVFISVISVCIFIMGLTCLCCLRMRARSRQRSQASGSRGFEGNTGQGDSPAFWTSTSSDQVFGLPSYEEATLSSDPSSSIEAEKPPAYESLYTSESSLPSTSTLPSLLEEEESRAQSHRETPSAPEG